MSSTICLIETTPMNADLQQLQRELDSSLEGLGSDQTQLRPVARPDRDRARSSHRQTCSNTCETYAGSAVQPICTARSGLLSKRTQGSRAGDSAGQIDPSVWRTAFGRSRRAFGGAGQRLPPSGGDLWREPPLCQPYDTRPNECQPMAKISAHPWPSSRQTDSRNPPGLSNRAVSSCDASIFALTLLLLANV